MLTLNKVWDNLRPTDKAFSIFHAFIALIVLNIYFCIGKNKKNGTREVAVRICDQAPDCGN